MLFKLNAEKRKWVDDAFSKMSVAEKLGQMVCDRAKTVFDGGALPDYMAKYPVGSAFVGAEIIDQASDSIEDVREKCAKLRAVTHPEQALLLCGDFEHGAGCVIGSLTRFPNPMALGAANDPELAYAEGEAIAVEAGGLGVRWAFAPVADLNLNINNQPTNHRAFGDDPDHVLPFLKAYIRGMQDHDFAACAKHFPGDGTDDRNQHNVTSLNTLSLPEWRRLHGRVFKELIDDGVLSIMIGHIGLPAYEPADARGMFRPATASRRLMTDLLRGELGFEGIIVTDALTMCGFCSYASYEQRMLDCFNGGADVFLWPDTPRFFELMLKALADGRASMERLDESARRVLEFKSRLGVDENRIPAPVSAADVARYRAAAARIGEKSATLLRNRNKLIPLKIKPGDKVLFLKSDHMPDRMPSERFAVFFSAFEKRGAKITVDKFENFKNHKENLEQYAAVVLMEHVTTMNANGCIRALGPIWPFMAHPYGRKICLAFGTPYFLHDVASADTYINAYCDSEAVQAGLARALFGEIPFAGTSPVDCGYEFKRGDGLTV